MKNLEKKIALLLVFIATSMSAQMGVGTRTPHPDAMLEVATTNKGILLPRVALTATTAVAPLSAHVAGMTVYNTATAGDVSPGYYYNDGSKWVKLATGQGLKGDTGEQGPVGPAGPQGDKGDKGDVGLTGPAGAQGLKGDKGDIGLTGPAGPQGLKGDKGDAGAAGAQGLKGDKGDVGLTGPAGANGVDGAVGPQGPIGLTGPAGPQGPAGANGVDGAAGPQGPIGLTGPAGADGAAGPQGPIGLTGPAGPTGPAGANGVDGAVGPQGPIGLTGPAGPQGPAGEKGETGAVGPQGPAGSDASVTGTAPIAVNMGVVTLSDLGVSNIKIANDAVTNSKIADNAVTIAKLPAGATDTTFLRGDGTWVEAASVTNIAPTEVALATKIDGAQLYAIKGSFTASGSSALVTITTPSGMTGYYSLTTYKDGKTFRRDISSFDIAATSDNVMTGTGAYAEVYPAGTYNYVLEYFK